MAVSWRQKCWRSASPESAGRSASSSRLPSGASLASELGLAVRSDYFYATVEARQGTTLGRARALLQRRAGAWPAVVWQVVE